MYEPIQYKDNLGNVVKVNDLVLFPSKTPGGREVLFYGKMVWDKDFKRIAVVIIENYHPIRAIIKTPVSLASSKFNILDFLIIGENLLPTKVKFALSRYDLNN